jgi:hypothetical protein
LEPLFVAVLTRFINGMLWPVQIYLSLSLVFVGVFINVFNEIKLSWFGVFSIMGANFSSALRNVLFKTDFVDQNDNNSSLTIYFHICSLSFLICAPLYLFSYILIDNSFISNINYDICFYLAIGSIFHFFYNLISLNILTGLSTLTHSVLNVIKRLITIFSALIYFGTRMTSIQFIGMFISDFGVLLYTYFKIKMNSSKDNIKIIPKETVDNRKTFSLIFIILIILSSLVGPSLFMNKYNYQVNKPINNDNEAFNISGIEIKKLFYNNKRTECINKIRNQIVETFEPIIPKNQSVFLLDVPVHGNLGDSLIW